MLLKQGYGKIKFFLKKFKVFFSRINPRYQMSLDDDYFDVKEKDRKFRFKSFGDHSFPEFTFKQIKQDPCVLFSINPYDVIKISEKNYIEEHLETQLKIDEFLRNNRYKLRNDSGKNVFSGDEICDNPLLADQIVKSDLFKIAYNTGFERGRKLFKLANCDIRDKLNENNIVELKCLVNTKFDD